jgi:hypothetical protein
MNIYMMMMKNNFLVCSVRENDDSSQNVSPHINSHIYDAEMSGKNILKEDSLAFYLEAE